MNEKENIFLTWDKLSLFARQKALNEIRKSCTKSISKKALNIYQKRINKIISKASSASCTKVFSHDGYFTSELGICINTNGLLNHLRYLNKDLFHFQDHTSTKFLESLIKTLIAGVSFYQPRTNGSISVQIFPIPLKVYGIEELTYEDIILSIILDQPEAINYEKYASRWLKDHNWTNLQKISNPVHSNNLINFLFYGDNPSGEIELLPISKLILKLSKILSNFIDIILENLITPLFNKSNQLINHWNEVFFEEEKLWLAQLRKYNFSFNSEGFIKKVEEWGYEQDITLVPPPEIIANYSLRHKELFSILQLDPIMFPYVSTANLKNAPEHDRIWMKKWHIHKKQ